MKLSIRKKTILLIIIFAFLLITLSTGMYARVIVNMTIEQYGDRAEDLAATAAGFVDAEAVVSLRTKVEEIYASVENKVFSDRWGEDDWNEYISAFGGLEECEEFVSLCKTLRKIQNANDAESVYLAYVDPENKALVYLVDAAYKIACPPGCIDVITDVNSEVLTAPERAFPAYKTDTEEYGRLITAGMPIYLDGKVVAYAMVDFSLDKMHDEQAKSVWKLYGYLVATAVLICIAALFYTKHMLVTPIKALTEASRRFAETRSGAKFGAFADLKIKAHDELQELAEAMKNMEVQINGNIKELVDMNKKLIASQNMASEMSELANKDALTGVRNKMAYEKYLQKTNEKIKSGDLNEFGVAMIDLNSLKQINDTHGHNRGDSAIVKLSQMICGEFVHSPVFRIGGDEFAVILMNDDYKNAAQLIEKFRGDINKNAADQSIPPEERITAALGYSEFDRKSDKCYDDVFERADKDMYRNKNEMKKS